MSYEDSLRVIEGVNNVIKNSGIDTNKVSDGYHTFGELYEHRIVLYLALCKIIEKFWPTSVWKSKTHSDGTSYEGWFIAGIEYPKGKQISYHLPISKWDEWEFCVTLVNAPEWDGHTSNDVLERLKQL